MNILLLGHSGMLGNAVLKFFEFNGVNVSTTDYRWPEPEFKSYIVENKYDFIINCIGAIPQTKKEFDINYELPIWLDSATSSYIVHPGTDCEIDDDEYGRSKRKAFEYITINSRNTKIIKTSIIGHEKHSKASLLDWFLNQKKPVYGYTNHLWNGNTTLEWSKFCYKMILDWSAYGTVNILTSQVISKYELLKIAGEVYGFDYEIIPYEHEKTVNNKCLNSDIILPNLREQLMDLKKFYKY